MREADQVRIRHMLDDAEKALSFADGRTRDDLDEDDQLVFALVKAVEIIGGADSRITPPTQHERFIHDVINTCGFMNKEAPSD